MYSRLYSIYCAIATITPNNETELALSFTVCMRKMGKPPTTAYNDGDTITTRTAYF